MSLLLAQTAQSNYTVPHDGFAALACYLIGHQGIGASLLAACDSAA